MNRTLPSQGVCAFIGVEEDGYEKADDDRQTNSKIEKPWLVRLSWSSIRISRTSGFRDLTPHQSKYAPRGIMHQTAMSGTLLER